MARRRTSMTRMSGCSMRRSHCPASRLTARENYDRGHIPGAVFFDIDDIAAPGTSLPHMIPSADLFARKIGALGIGDDDKVVVYDSAGLSSAGRAWWMLRLFGHREVALLDGGLPKWQAEGRRSDDRRPGAGARAISPRASTRPWCATRWRSSPISRAAANKSSMPAPPAVSTAARRRSGPDCAAAISQAAATFLTTG